MHLLLYVNYEATRRRVWNTTLPDAIRYDPFNSLWDLQWYDRLLRWFTFIPLALVWMPNLLNWFEVCCRGRAQAEKHRAVGRMCQKVLRYLENVTYLLVGVVLIILTFVHNGVDFSRAMAHNMTAMYWLVMALTLLCSATAATAYTFRSTQTDVLRSATAGVHVLFGLALILAVPYDDWSAALLQEFAGILIILGALAGRGCHYMQVAATTRTLADHMVEHGMYLCYSIAAVLMCSISAVDSFPIGYLLDDRNDSPLWPLVIFLIVVLITLVCTQLLWLCVGHAIGYDLPAAVGLASSRSATPAARSRSKRGRMQVTPLREEDELELSPLLLDDD